MKKQKFTISGSNYAKIRKIWPLMWRTRKKDVLGNLMNNDKIVKNFHLLKYRSAFLQKYFKDELFRKTGSVVGSTLTSVRRVNRRLYPGAKLWRRQDFPLMWPTPPSSPGPRSPWRPFSRRSVSLIYRSRKHGGLTRGWILIQFLSGLKINWN